MSGELVREAVEEAEDAAAYDQAHLQDDGVSYPAAVARGIAEGTSPLKAWREHKGLTLQSLADAAGLSRAFVSQIEGGKRTGTTTTLKKLADALGVPVGALLDL